ncbi:uptake [ni/fe] hydrogenase small subunit [Heliomicrobium modesticaldum Ice1]|uniref:Uptake [ni/fe] hydrogenase small subunit n=1 Tax=Heliobacterium modesticaldum (strain ATCC 51547 / Ice1) TaxID=498761 RepID=B0TCM5_HELMI|nr:hydrogenase small subunit [Heliomicrobium modesticaldum]ABZ84051.1 uptake [ni/fe] hydrogenase small subunit [Heliomicrobium modesticaldum Ice1]
MAKEETYYQYLKRRGVSRRDFLKFCTVMAASLGLSAGSVPKIAEALETKKRIPVIWRHLVECTCCTESFIRSHHPIAADILLNMISLDYDETLMVAAGERAEEAARKSMEENKGNYILAVEGAVSTKDGGIYCVLAGRSSVEILKEEAKNAKAIIAWGSCAVNGCIAAANPNPSGSVPVQEIIKDKPIINVPGCPPIAEVMAGVITHLITFDRLPELDREGRPKAFYGHRIHDKCNRRAYFDAGMFVESFDDEGAKQGWCLYKVGCKGPNTYNSCANMEWNGGVSYDIKSGHPCIGCSEKGFWDNTGGQSFYTHLAEVPGLQIGMNVDQFGIAAVGAAAVGAAVHAGFSAVTKRAEEKREAKGGCNKDSLGG